MVELLALEVGARRPGSRAASARLIDTLLIAAIRHWLDRQPDAEPKASQGSRAEPGAPGPRARRSPFDYFFLSVVVSDATLLLRSGSGVDALATCATTAMLPPFPLSASLSATLSSAVAPDARSPREH